MEFRFNWSGILHNFCTIDLLLSADFLHALCIELNSSETWETFFFLYAPALILN